MGSKTVVQKFCDKTGEFREDVQLVDFALYGVTYLTEVSPEKKKELETFLEEWMAHSKPIFRDDAPTRAKWGLEPAPQKRIPTRGHEADLAAARRESEPVKKPTRPGEWPPGSRLVTENASVSTGYSTEERRQATAWLYQHGGFEISERGQFPHKAYLCWEQEKVDDAKRAGISQPARA